MSVLRDMSIGRKLTVIILSITTVSLLLACAAVMRAAHSLKGELGYIGAPEAAQAARQLEDMGHEKNLSRAQELFTLLERELAELHLALKEPAGAML